MNPIFLVAAAALVVAQVALPRRLGFIPLIIAGFHLGNVEILPELTPARLLIVIGLARAVADGTFATINFGSKIDRLFLVFAAVILLSTIGHRADQYVPSPLSARLGLVLNTFGSYLYARAYITDFDAVRRYVRFLPLVLVPLAALLTVEKVTRQNLYFRMGAASERVNVREDKVRAMGPFRHPILTGTAGAVALPLCLALWRRERKRSAIGIAACLAIVVASASSGPAAATAFCIAGVFFWHWRRHLPKVLLGAVLVALLYSAVSGRGPWFIMARIDLAGGSTGWHRAQLIDQGLRNLDEWWLWGTDRTRHWMPTGVTWNPNMTDLTNYYLHLGVIAGMPAIIALLWIVRTWYRALGNSIREMFTLHDGSSFELWCLGVSLGAHLLSFISISYFDQMYVFFYFLLGAVPGVVENLRRQSAESEPSHAG